MPEATPPTRPVPVTVAMPVLLLDQAPIPGSLSSVVAPAQTVAVPEIADGNGLTVTIIVFVHPVGAVKIIADVPATTPPITPVADPAVAMDVLLLAQVPGPEASVSVVVDPAHTVAMPVIAAGCGFTERVVVAAQSPPPNE